MDMIAPCALNSGFNHSVQMVLYSDIKMPA